MQAFNHVVTLTAPLFALIALGYLLSTRGRWPAAAADALTRFVFSIAVPVLLFKLMSGFGSLPPVDPRLLIAYFGGCLLVFVVGRMVAFWGFGMDGAGQSLFALGGIFSNNVLLGIPLAKLTLGEAAIPAFSLVLLFNALLLWTLCTVSVEWARHGEFSAAGIGTTAREVVTNPIVAGILLGTAWSYTGRTLPAVIDQTLTLITQAAVPLSLIALGMGLAQFGVRAGWRESLAITAIKLVLQPLTVFALARLLRLPERELQAIVLMAGLPVGANVYLMSRQFDTLEGPIAASLVLSTAIASASTPLLLVLIGSGAG
jgi:predicted permease